MEALLFFGSSIILWIAIVDGK